ncbi:MAG: outer membrane lipoprotein carrier protein LolA [Rickettsiales bacterium]|nr:outer membrane lipoprotein carrier protein LolA [Rickettsiales bacterium]
MRAFFLFLLSAMYFAAPAYAASTRQETLAKLLTYLNGLTTIESEFVQVAPDGSLATGRFFLKRPGKMRWQYNPPVPVLMISNGSTLTYYDFELDQVSNVSLDETLAGFLARETINFDPKAVKILELTEQDHVIRLRLTQTNQPDEGELTLEFSDAPLQLRNMIVKDASGQETNVSLTNAQFGLKLDNKLFIFRDPRIYRKR